MKLILRFDENNGTLEFDSWDGLVPPPDMGDVLKIDDIPYLVIRRTMTLASETSTPKYRRDAAPISSASVATLELLLRKS